MEVIATAKNIRVAPRKIRLILDTIRGKQVGEALAILHFMPSPSAKQIAKVVRSAIANAENNYSMTPTGLRIVKTWADVAPVLKRWKPQARGRVGQMRKRASHVSVVVEEA